MAARAIGTSILPHIEDVLTKANQLLPSYVQSKGMFRPDPTIPRHLCVIRTAIACILQTFAVLMFNSKIAV